MLSYFSQLQHKHQLLFTVIISFAVVLFWRGVWGIIDALTTPMYTGQDFGIYLFSFMASTVVGLIILVGSGFAMKELI
jgi:hypothetical protein